MGKIRVLHFELEGSEGGIEMFLLNLYTQIDRNRFQFDFATSSDTPAFKDQFEKLGANIYRIPNLRNIIAYKNAVCDLYKCGYDAVHIHKNTAANIIPLLEAKRMNLPLVVVHSHNTFTTKGKMVELLHVMNRKMLYDCASVHLACSDLAGKWMYKYGTYELVKNGIFVDRFKYDCEKRMNLRAELNINETTFVVGNVGRFKQQKNHMRFLNIFRAILEINHDCVALLVGDGPLKDMCKNYALQLGIQNKTRFLGVRRDISDLMQAMDAFIMPSLYEGLPIAGVEAQASGLKTYFSNAISTEIELTEQVQWFGLEQEDIEIAKMIVNGGKPTEEERIAGNLDVKKAGYNISTTSKRMEELYLRSVKSKNNPDLCK